MNTQKKSFSEINNLPPNISSTGFLSFRIVNVLHFSSLFVLLSSRRKIRRVFVEILWFFLFPRNGRSEDFAQVRSLVRSFCFFFFRSKPIDLLLEMILIIRWVLWRWPTGTKNNNSPANRWENDRIDRYLRFSIDRNDWSNRKRRWPLLSPRKKRRKNFSKRSRRVSFRPSTNDNLFSRKLPTKIIDRVNLLHLLLFVWPFPNLLQSTTRKPL